MYLYQKQDKPLELTELKAGDINTGLNVVEVTFGGVVFKVQYLRVKREYLAIAANGDRYQSKTLGVIKSKIRAYVKPVEFDSIKLEGKVVGSIMKQLDQFFYRPKGTTGKFDGQKYATAEQCFQSVKGD